MKRLNNQTRIILQTARKRYGWKLGARALRKIISQEHSLGADIILSAIKAEITFRELGYEV